jgi:hypothetical protein
VHNPGGNGGDGIEVSADDCLPGTMIANNIIVNT